MLSLYGSYALLHSVSTWIDIKSETHACQNVSRSHLELALFLSVCESFEYE